MENTLVVRGNQYEISQLTGAQKEVGERLLALDARIRELETDVTYLKVARKSIAARFVHLETEDRGEGMDDTV